MSPHRAAALQLHPDPRAWTQTYAAQLCDIASFLHVLSDHADREFSLTFSGPSCTAPVRLHFDAELAEDRVAAKALTWAARAFLSPDDVVTNAGGPATLVNHLGGQKLSPHIEDIALKTIVRFWQETRPGEALPASVLALFRKQDGRRQALETVLTHHRPVMH